MKEKREYITTKFWAKTRKALKIIAAETGETMVQVIDRLAVAEYDKVTKKNQNN